jgi:hypothetical protein
MSNIRTLEGSTQVINGRESALGCPCGGPDGETVPMFREALGHVALDALVGKAHPRGHQPECSAAPNSSGGSCRLEWLARRPPLSRWGEN